jgi:hypothetical protein
MSAFPRSTVPLLLTLGILAACGGEDAPAQRDTDAPAPDTLVRSIPREPLTQDDLVGFTLADVSVELPWTVNRVRRGGSPRAAPARVQAVEVSGHEGFDRVVFEFSDAAPFPGYEVEVGEPVTGLECDGDEITPTLSTGSALVIHIRPARGGEDQDLSARTQGFGLTRFQEGGIVCEDQAGLIWMAGLAEGEQIRAFELRGPNRLVVDIR